MKCEWWKEAILTDGRDTEKETLVDPESTLFHYSYLSCFCMHVRVRSMPHYWTRWQSLSRSGIFKLVQFTTPLLWKFKDVCISILCLWGFCMHVCHLCNTCMPHANRGQKRGLDPLELLLQVVVNHHVGTGNKPKFPRRATGALHCWTFYFAPSQLRYIIIIYYLITSYMYILYSDHTHF